MNSSKRVPLRSAECNERTSTKYFSSKLFCPFRFQQKKKMQSGAAAEKELLFDVYNLLVIAIRFNFAAQQPHVV